MRRMKNRLQKLAVIDGMAENQLPWRSALQVVLRDERRETQRDAGEKLVHVFLPFELRGRAVTAAGRPSLSPVVVAFA